MAVVKYQGRHRRGVNVPTAGGDIAFPFGGTAELPDDLAAKLCAEQPDAFSIVKPEPVAVPADESPTPVKGNTKKEQG